MVIARREYGIRFQPHGGGHVVPASAYIKALGAALEGLSSVRHAVAPVLAVGMRWSPSDIREALEVSVGPTAPGSLLVPLEFTGPHLAAQSIAPVFWRYASQLLRRAAAPTASVILSASCATSFARASSFAWNDGRSALELVSCRAGGAWVQTADLTALETTLRAYAERREAASASRTQLIGRLVELSYDPPRFVVDGPRGRATVTMPAELRGVAQSLWGRDVIVEADAKLSSDGTPQGARALSVRGVITHEDPGKEFEQSRGAVRDVWATDDAREYIEGLRPSLH